MRLSLSPSFGPVTSLTNSRSMIVALKYSIKGCILVDILAYILKDICDGDSDELVRLTEELMGTKSVDYNNDDDSLVMTFEEDSIIKNLPSNWRQFFSVVKE